MFFENIKEALVSLKSNKMRSLLTMLGIIIGITAVITITTIGSSIKSTLNATMNSLGGNTITVYLDAVYPDDPKEQQDWSYPDMKDSDYITSEMLAELEQTYPEEISGYINNVSVGSGQVWENKDHYANVALAGVTPNYLDYMKLNILKGRAITTQDNEKAKKVCVISDTMAANYFGNKNPIGEQISVNIDSGAACDLVVVGVYEYSDAIFGQQDTTVPEKDRMTSLFMPEKAAIKMSSQDTAPGYDYLNILVKNTADVQMAAADVQTFLDEKYADNPNWKPTATTMQSELGMINTVINVITVAISFIAAISLVVGGVGVMNIMLVSITERTKEIGIRKALGAKNKDISQQFLIESIVLCLIGGVLGIIFGMLLGYGIGQIAMYVIKNYYSQYESYIIMSVHPSAIAIVLSVMFSMLIGVFFGHYPAKKAAQMEVIDALRYE